MANLMPLLDMPHGRMRDVGQLSLDLDLRIETTTTPEPWDSNEPHAPVVHAVLTAKGTLLFESTSLDAVWGYLRGIQDHDRLTDLRGRNDDRHEVVFVNCDRYPCGRDIGKRLCRACYDWPPGSER